MKPIVRSFAVNRRALLSTLAVLPALSAPLFSLSAPAQTATPDGVLLSWNDGPAKQAILDFVRATTDPASPKLVPPEERIATFDQDGTLWVEHPVYSQLIYCFDRVPAVVKAKPALAKVEPFKTVLSGDREAIAKLPLRGLEEIAIATLSGMTVDEFDAEVKKWLSVAKDPRWKRPYTDLTYLRIRVASFPPPAHLRVKCPDFGQFGSCGSALPTDRRLPTSILRTSRNGKCP